MSEGRVEIIMCERMEADGERGHREGDYRTPFLSLQLEAAGFSCHIQEEDLVDVGQMRGRGEPDARERQQSLGSSVGDFLDDSPPEF